MQISYKFSVPAPTPPKESRSDGIVRHTYNEFSLDLQDHWQSYPSPDPKTLNFYSDKTGAAIILSVQFFAVPDEKAEELANVCIDSRIEAHEQQFPGRVKVLTRSVRPHPGGIGWETSYSAEAEGHNLFIYVGYVTPRKVLNFQMVCNPGREEGAALFNQVMEGFRVKMP
ncbi:hypothetical protein [Ramlibacter alkalitolerans]|uniref:DUF1795 domain-containing protein n=1 Tax=Ramlibacter alkalitolerans TaxID=2039631 RepID=A0ABS1JR23_9BURK|nr:hypothetical protein [Ramlibacter alkalitolerans]MBL0426715.1 hypothetical protein [Ramlibacter alkalitolerans]